jgi:ABC-type nitrate/sulfonate/bicarbonate transport system ATPase subunit
VKLERKTKGNAESSPRSGDPVMRRAVDNGGRDPHELSTARAEKAVAVAVRDLWAGYGDTGCDGSRTAVLAGLGFEIEPGERLAIVGQSGCGKSTLLSVLAGLLPPLEGEVVVDGRVVAATHHGVAGRRVCCSGHAAYMFQRDLLLPWKDVAGNAAFAAQVASSSPEPGRPGVHRPRVLGGLASESRALLRARARAILQELGLGDALHLVPAQLSGGMRQRVALARTLVLGRGLILLDEPFGSLDALTRAEMQGWLLDVMAAHAATWVLVTHDVQEAVVLGDRVAILAGRPARLYGWLTVGLSASQRRALARLQAGEAALAPRSKRDAHIDADCALATMRDLTAEVLACLRQRRAS